MGILYRAEPDGARPPRRGMYYGVPEWVKKIGGGGFNGFK